MQVSGLGPWSASAHSSSSWICSRSDLLYTISISFTLIDMIRKSRRKEFILSQSHYVIRCQRADRAFHRLASLSHKPRPGHKEIIISYLFFEYFPDDSFRGS